MSAAFGPSISSLVNMMLGTHSKRVFCHLCLRLELDRPSPTSFSFRQHRVSWAIIVSNMPIFLNPDRGTVPPSSRLHMLHTWPCSTPSLFGTLLTIQRFPNVMLPCSVQSRQHTFHVHTVRRLASQHTFSRHNHTGEADPGPGVASAARFFGITPCSCPRAWYATRSM